MHSMKVLALLLAAAFATQARAASYPERNITVIVPFPAGGASDITARTVSHKLSENLKQTVIIDNRGGANGAIGATFVKGAPADGYTLMIASIGVYAINPALFKDLKYDPLKDFDLLSVHVRTPNVLVTSTDFPVNNVAELIDYLKKNPQKVTFASSGSGSSDHLTAALFWQKTGTTGIHVPYRGGGPTINDLVAGHANVSFQNLGSVAQHIRGGKLKALAITSDKRAAAMPDLPTMRDAGVSDLEVYSWQAASAPKGLPSDIRSKLEAELVAAANAPDVKSKLEDIGFEVVASSGAQFTDFLTKEIARWRNVIEIGKITPE